MNLFNQNQEQMQRLDKTLITRNSKGKIRVVEAHCEWCQDKMGFVIHRLSYQYKGKKTPQPDLLIQKGKAKRTVTEQARLEFDSLVNKWRDKGYKELSKSIDDYTEEELKQIVLRTSRVLNSPIDEEAAYELARRSRGTPRVANRLFKRVRDFALVMGDGNIDLNITKTALEKLKVDEAGLDATDYNLLNSIIERFNGGPVGIDALASSIGEEASTIEDVYEPYLLQNGFLKRTSRGRMVTEKAYDYLKKNRQDSLF